MQRMTFAERGMYLEMLLEQWESFTLPDSPEECAELIGGTAEEWRGAWAALRRKFVSDTPGLIYNLRLERARKERRRFTKMARAGGVARANSAKRGKDGTFSPAEDQPDTSTATALASSFATASASASAVDSPPPVGVVLSFPTIGKGPRTWELTEAQIAEWAECFPGLHIEAECRKALAWVRANHPKTASGMPAFLVNWFNRTVAKGGGTKLASTPEPAAIWVCPHVEHCASRDHCKNALFLGKKPLKQAEAV